MGYFITFEGVEGCGKTTQIRLLAEQLIAHGFVTTLTREPGGCPIADKIRTILLDAENRAMSPMTELMLYAAARAQHVND
ncbi:MAG: dTMP kinase, partial [Steroidobacteraceae bacterium]|nr:dTMP kinase [Deltaproteobacteria bacterium]